MTDEEIAKRAALAIKIDLHGYGLPEFHMLDLMMKKAVEVARPLILLDECEGDCEADHWYRMAFREVPTDSSHGVSWMHACAESEAERDRLMMENDNLRSTLYQLDTEAYPEWESLYAAEAQERTQLVADRTRLRSALVRIAETGGWVTFTAGDGELGLRNDARGMATEALDGEA